MESLKEMWQLVREQLKASCGEVIYEMWIMPLEIIRFDGTKAEIEASEFAKGIIEKRFSDDLKEAFRAVMGFDVEVVIVGPDKPSAAKAQPERNKAPSVTSTSIETNTFETFVVGSSNRFAHAAAQAVAATPGSAYNPLFIYGNSGLGKTHLLCAISNEVKRNNPDADIIFTRGEDFVTLIIEGIKEKKMKEIHEKYRNCDMLLVDDIQFIAGKESTQEEFFHTFNALTQDNKQIVLTSDRAPKDIEILDERLRNRFEWGLIADIQPPDIETRMAIIQRKATTLGLELPQDVVQFVAEKIKTNIRQLEGAVKKINALVNIEGASINIAMAQNAIKDIMNDSRPVSSIVGNIIAETSRTFGVPQADITSKKKDAKTAKARQVAIYIVREITDLTQKEISEYFGNRDRTTILYSIESIKQEVERDSSLKKTVDNIIKNAREQ
ncbi:MAG: chromosomal replication initiator protein DnaA [Clostridia bacterium]|nr:chromosomal replication initiator protein DnaA [Clostridia bacterium]MBQ3007902.1 chromosomal replication initiator protein DnaA [Clostridia bacterium]